MLAVGSAPSVLVTAPYASSPTGHRHAIQARTLSAMIVERFMGCLLAELARLEELAKPGAESCLLTLHNPLRSESCVDIPAFPGLRSETWGARFRARLSPLPS